MDNPLDRSRRGTAVFAMEAGILELRELRRPGAECGTFALGLR